MRTFLVGAIACLLWASPQGGPAHACTSFCLETPDGPVYGTNLDLTSLELLKQFKPCVWPGCGLEKGHIARDCSLYLVYHRRIEVAGGFAQQFDLPEQVIAHVILNRRSNVAGGRCIVAPGVEGGLGEGDLHLVGHGYVQFASSDHVVEGSAMISDELIQRLLAPLIVIHTPIPRR